MLNTIYKKLCAAKDGMFPPEINLSINQTELYTFPHNYLLFRNRDGDVLGKAVELNGFLAFEALLRNILQKPLLEGMHESIEIFRGNGNIFGWWPVDCLKTGKNYFLHRKNIPMHPNIDDTAQGQRYFKISINDKTVNEFLFERSVQGDYQEILDKLNIPRNRLLRVWNYEPWAFEVDLVSITNMLCCLTKGVALQDEVFECNRRVVNEIIEMRDYRQFYRYAEPKVAGTWLLLFFDCQYRSFLSPKSRERLLNDLRQEYKDLQSKHYVARWGGSNGYAIYYHGVHIELVNECLTPLMCEYAEQYLLKEKRECELTKNTS